METTTPDPLITEVLESLYKPGKILAQQVEELKPRQCRITFVFPPYDRTIKAVEHISAVQMHEAILEGLLCTIGTTIQNGFLPEIDFSTFLKRRLETLFIRENLTFRRMIKPNEEVELTFTITQVGEKQFSKTYHSVVVSIAGFLQGEIECCLEK